MPIYSFCCPTCEVNEDVLMPVERRDTTRFHLCGCKMQREMTIPQPPIMVDTGRDKTLNVLNNKNGHDFPGGNKNRARYEKHFAQGLDPEKPVIGRGF